MHWVQHDCSKSKLANHKDASLKMCADGLDTCMKTATEVDGTTGVISKCSTKTSCETGYAADMMLMPMLTLFVKKSNVSNQP